LLELNEEIQMDIRAEQLSHHRATHFLGRNPLMHAGIQRSTEIAPVKGVDREKRVDISKFA
jgi:hypothetical protein